MTFQEISSKEQQIRELKEILKELVLIDGGFDRKISDSDFDFIKNFLKKNNFNSIDIIHDEKSQSNLFASLIGDSKREKEIDFMFLGHLDVVDPGDKKKWKNENPFSLFEDDDGVLLGRGVVDMKGSIAAFLLCLKSIQTKNLNFNLGIMIAGDEEKESFGARALKNFLQENNWKIDSILIGEPTSEKEIGDILKIGRRGSANFDLSLLGAGGHVAYPQKHNLIHEFLPDLISNFKNFQFNDQNEFFDSSNLVITQIQTFPQNARNVLACEVKISFNIRYNSSLNLDLLEHIIKEIIESKTQIPKNFYKKEIFSNFGPFLSKKTEFCNLLSKSIEKIKNFKPKFQTNGGTSDGRFFHDIANIIEFGAKNDSAHKINENISTDDLYSLFKIYEDLIISYNDSIS